MILQTMHGSIQHSLGMGTVGAPPTHNIWLHCIVYIGGFFLVYLQTNMSYSHFRSLISSILLLKAKKQNKKTQQEHISSGFVNLTLPHISKCFLSLNKKAAKSQMNIILPYDINYQ